MNFGDWDKDFDIELAMKESLRVIKKGRSIIFFCAWQQLEELRKLFDDANAGADNEEKMNNIMKLLRYYYFLLLQISAADHK